MNGEIYIAVTRSDNSVAHVAFQTRGRFPARPVGGWTLSADGLYWEREPTDGNIEYELHRLEVMWSNDKDNPVWIISWRRINDDEHDIFNTHRHYRDSLTDRDGRIEHDMSKARDMHRSLLRHMRSEKFAALDADWMRAISSGDTKAAKDADAKRQILRDMTNDPRIDIAKTCSELENILP